MRSLRFVAIVSVAMAVVMSEPIGASGIKTMKGRRAEKMKLNDRQQQRRMKKTFDGATVTKMAKDGDRRGPPQDAYAQSDGGRGRGNSKTSSEARGAPKRVSTTGRTPLPALQLRGRTPRPQPSGDEQESPAVEQGRSNPDAPGQSGPGPGSPQNQNQGNPQNPPRATSSPTRRPTLQPTNPPTPSPTAQPTKSPTRSPTPPPTDQPTNSPTRSPTPPPTPKPTNSPTRSPTPPPTPKPTDSPTKRPTPAPVPAGSPQDNIPVPQNPVIPSSTESPTKSPTDIPTPSPTPVPTPTPPIPATGLSAPDQSDAPDEYQFIRDAIVANGFAGLTMPQNADEGSYVRSALDWISSENNPSSLSDEQLVQRYALACIYYATYGVPNDLTALRDGQGQTPEGWPYDAGWMTDEDECSWEGIVCDDRGEVEAIELYSNELTGHFPNECVLLKESLKKLDLYDNIYMNNVGKEQHDFLGELTGLELLWLSDTGMEYDGVPEALGNLVNLIELDCGYMSWFGELDGTIFSNMRDLEMLLLSGNLFFESIIPTELGLLPDLAYVYLDDCNMGGDLSALPSIKGGVEFMFGDNPGIGGTIPSNLDEVEYLEVLSAYNCSLTGSIPESIGNIENLAEIELYINDLTGPIPSSIGGLTDLVIFYFDGNNDIDGIPEEICRITENDGFDSMTANCLQGCTCCTECY